MMLADLPERPAARTTLASSSAAKPDPPDVVARCVASAGGLINAYGPTETTVLRHHELEPADPARGSSRSGDRSGTRRFTYWTMAWSLCRRGLRASFTSRARGWRAVILGGRG